jgi:WD40 repeat protein
MPKFFIILSCEQAHDGGVVAVELSRVMGSAPQLITIGADKTLAIWDTMTFKVYSKS